jgi:hypothetical protein
MASGEMSEAEFQDFLRETLGTAAAVSRDGAVHFVCMDWRHMGSVLAVETVYGQLLNLCIWNKSNAGMGSLYRSRHELVFVYRVGNGRHFNAQQDQCMGLCLSQFNARKSARGSIATSHGQTGRPGERCDLRRDAAW